MDNAPPYHMLRDDGSVEGLAVDVFTEAAKRKNIRIVWVPKYQSTIEAEFRANRVDAWPAVSRTPGREKMFHFTEPWIESNYYLVTRKKSGVTRQTLNGLRVALAGFPRMKIVAAKFLPGAQPVHLLTHESALQEFCSSLADAALLDARTLDSILLERPDGCGSVPIRLEFLPEASNPVSIASRPDKALAADALQAGIMEVAADGGMVNAIDKWSGFSAAQTRSFFALRDVESRRDLYRVGFAVVTLFAVVFAWAMARLRVAHGKAAKAERAAADSEARFSAFMDHSPLVGYIKDDRGRMLYLNRTWVEVFGRSLQECVGKDDYALWPESLAAELRRNDISILKGGNTVEFVETLPAKNGESRIWLSLKFPFQQGLQTFVGGMSIDITERERAKEALRISEERFRSLFSHATVGIAIADARGMVSRVNNAFCRILRMEESDCLQGSVQTLLERRSETSPMALAEMAAAGITFETEHHRSGGPLWTENCLFSVRDSAGEAVNIVVIVEEITQRKIAEKQLDYQARHDLLTGLPNRRVHESYLDLKLAEAKERRRKFCLVYIDLDEFKIVNDTMGHDAGDLLLQEAARRLGTLTPEPDALSRIGGDEFVLVQSISDRDDAVALSARLRLAMEEPFEINGRNIGLRASAGCSIYPDDGMDARTLRKKADDAMYSAKRAEKSNRYMGAQEIGEELKVLSALQ